MKKEKSTDYNIHYAPILAIEKDQGKISATDFLIYIIVTLIFENYSEGNSTSNPDLKDKIPTCLQLFLPLFTVRFTIINLKYK